MNSPKKQAGTAEAGKTKMENSTNGNGNGRRTILGPNTLMPVGVMVTLLLTIIAAVFWLDTRFDELEVRMMEIERSIGDRWTGNDMKLWTEMMQRKNPGHVIPDPWEIVKHREN